MRETTRRPVAAWTATDGGGAPYETVVCDDGTVFWRFFGDDEWREDTPIPGTPAAGGMPDVTPDLLEAVNELVEAVAVEVLGPTPGDSHLLRMCKRVEAAIARATGEED